MNNQYLLEFITSYLKVNEVFPKFLIISKKYHRMFFPQFIKRFNSPEAYISLKNYFHSVVKYAPPCNVKIKSYGIIISHERSETVYIYIYAFPRYLQGHNIGVRYTSNNWETYTDSKAFWVWNENDIEVWKVDINISYHAENFIEYNKSIEFVIYGKNLQNHCDWDNNNGYNFKIGFPRPFYGGYLLNN